MSDEDESGGVPKPCGKCGQIPCKCQKPVEIPE